MNTELDKVNILSVSGGKDSTAMYVLALERGIEFRAVFADVPDGDEPGGLYALHPQPEE